MNKNEVFILVFIVYKYTINTNLNITLLMYLLYINTKYLYIINPLKMLHYFCCLYICKHIYKQHK